jgi:hypothetical protein
MRNRCVWVASGLVLAALAAAGCDRGPAMGEVSGTVTVDGQTPAAGSSISFEVADGKGPTAGALIADGKYTTKVPVGATKVRIKVPRPIAKQRGPVQGGPGHEPGSDRIEESLPAKYNDKTELTFEVKPGKNEKNWELSTK